MYKNGSIITNQIGIILGSVKFLNVYVERDMNGYYRQTSFAWVIAMLGSDVKISLLEFENRQLVETSK